MVKSKKSTKSLHPSIYSPPALYIGISESKWGPRVLNFINSARCEAEGLYSVQCTVYTVQLGYTQGCIREIPYTKVNTFDQYSMCVLNVKIIKTIVLPSTIV